MQDDIRASRAYHNTDVKLLSTSTESRGYVTYYRMKGNHSGVIAT